MTDYEALYAKQDDVCGAPFSEYVDFFKAQDSGQRVLDLGCGQGRDALCAARQGHSVVGVDLSPSGVRQMVEAAEVEGLSVTGIVADIAEFEPGEIFDVIVIDRVLHMLPSGETRQQVVERMTRHVRPGGHLLIADTPKNLPLIRETLRRPGWSSTLSRKGFSFWRKDAPGAAPDREDADPTGVTCGDCDTALIQQDWHGLTYPTCPACKCIWPIAQTLALVHQHRRPRPAGATLSLTYEPNGTDHHDLLLRLGPWAHRSDSYYYALDHATDEPAETVGSMRGLLKRWATAVEGCKDGGTVFLPHAFLDQCTGWLRCTRHGGAFEVIDGWSNIEGYSIYPSDYADAAQRMDDFQPDESAAPIVIPRTHLLGDIQASIDALAAVKADLQTEAQ